MAYKLNVFSGTLFDIVDSGVRRVGNTTDKHIVRWLGNNSDTIENSLASIQDSGAVNAQGFITNSNVSGTVLVDVDEAWIAPGLTINPGGIIKINPGGKLILI